MTTAELQYKMCPSDIKCLKGRPCPFLVNNDCRVSDGFNRQLSTQIVNNPMNYKRQWSLAEQIHANR
jgi:hypothetical protein